MTDLLHLVRHGETTWNAEHRLQGHGEAALSPRGQAEARALAPAVAALGVAPERILASDLRRTRETAALLGLTPARFDAVWREIDVGSWSGRIDAEVDAEEPALTNWRGGPRTADDGEPWPAFAARVARAVDGLARQGGSWLVVCHGGVVRAAAQHLTRADPLRLASPPNASLTTFALDAPPLLCWYGVTFTAA